jgi:peptidoglycan/LPS O-acetylase OafA/YrhL
VIGSCVSESNTTSIYRDAARSVSSFSYTLYVIHSPALLFLTSLLAHDTRWMPTDPVGVLFALGAAITVIALSWIVASWTEFKTESVRRWITASVFKCSQQSIRNVAATGS